MGDEKKLSEGIAGKLIRKISDAAVRAGGKYAPDVERGRMWFRASTNQLCPDCKVIEPGAWKRGMKAYMKNPIILDSHHYDSVVERTLGKAVDWELDDLGLMLLVEFAQTAPGAAARYLYFEGFANAGSVGWDTIKSERVTDEDSGTEYERITQAQLLEFSLCPVGADNEALSKHDNPLLEMATRMLAAPVTETRPGWDEPEDGHMIHYRIRPPEDFTGKFVTLSLDVKAEGDVQVVRGHFKGEADDGELHAQSIRFDKDKGWTMAEAKSWWASHKDKLGREVEGEGDLSMVGLVEAHKAIRAELDKILVLCSNIRTAIAVKSTTHTLYLENGTEVKVTYEPDPLVARLRQVADAVTLTDEELLEGLRHGLRTDDD